jgi:hypothetical protein
VRLEPVTPCKLEQDKCLKPGEFRYYQLRRQSERRRCPLGPV